MEEFTEKTILIWKKILDKKSIVLFVVFLIFILFIGASISQKLLITVPKKGGEIHEIVLNSKIRFINPVLSLSPVDKDLVSLIYSPLLRIDQGEIIENIASYTLSSDKRTYTIHLNDNVFFHDGVQLTTDDIIFTIKKIQDPLIKSPYYSSWLEVETEKINNYDLEIKLKNEYYQFINSLVLYILPKHLWENIAPEEFPFSELNIKPIGSGPFSSEVVDRNESGEIKQYILKSFEEHHSQEAYLNKITFHFFDDLKKYQASIFSKDENSFLQTFFTDSKEISEEILKEEKLFVLQTPKVFGLFIQAFKDNKYLSSDKFRNLLALIIKKIALTETPDIDTDDFEELPDFEYSEAGELTFNDSVVYFSITFFQDEKFNRIANIFKERLENSGIEVILREINKEGELENIIRDRDFETILFGYNPGLIKDLFYFFHSSQVNDPGVNIAGIKNSTIDKLLLELRKNISSKDRESKTKEIEKNIDSSDLFIPLYSSREFYKVPQELKNFQMEKINSRENRFDNIENWYLKEERILPFLQRN